jgi:hypothetical protein
MCLVWVTFDPVRSLWLLEKIADREFGYSLTLAASGTFFRCVTLSAMIFVS